MALMTQTPLPPLTKDLVEAFMASAALWLARLMGVLFNPLGSFKEGVAALRNLDNRIHSDGEIELARACAERGTIVVTPTHSSNMDSPAIGFGLMQAGLPPATYGAGKNLFSNPFISFFMRNLGAYRVDRRLRFELYKDVLKEYSTVLLEHGYHSLFFPGGTRSRSNSARMMSDARPWVGGGVLYSTPRLVVTLRGSVRMARNVSMSARVTGEPIRSRSDAISRPTSPR